MTIGERIKERRKELKMNGEELAKKIGKNRATLYRYENGEIENLPLDILEPIARALDTTPVYLMGWEEVKKNNDAMSDIIVRMRTDEKFFNAVSIMYGLDEVKFDSINQMLSLLK